jgi:hypothetical protein
MKGGAIMNVNKIHHSLYTPRYVLPKTFRDFKIKTLKKYHKSNNIDDRSDNNYRPIPDSLIFRDYPDDKLFIDYK